MDVKARIQRLMEERGWTIYRLAKETGVPGSTLRNMFKRNNGPSIYTLECICRGMGLSLPQFFDEDNSMGLSGEQLQLVSQWNRLAERDRQLVLELLRALNREEPAS